ncbi:CRISPR-associated protein Csb1 [Streptoalloteichus tenebrarius]|uniref:CRISPR-associated protein Csb1 n=1 Tax=Streptoalloteichus tenebrarius (strain ATCC 17920 / DSM 40477 / JCM 4838 / CBS 697.72 / NBRC 16177 / NCIMB 11028 / NRRL B-12390 / A12253. 1 / ISP 5477) TaxID=1933 RepID=A0ABT1I1G9_STRSD|nr:type I-U CRISPR-associated RAMP protein Csb1/Cas7u [Streptoalloteichus tenebrarius]MCP2261642.1 CRISPR-associated protein Csb1 [Streptoalloteichus tenebrarius]
MADVYGRLERAVSLSGEDAAVVITARLEPIGGVGTRVFPPTYPLDAVNDDATKPRRPYVVEPRRMEDGVVETVLLDSVQSESNRVEEALERAVAEGRLRLPHLLVEHELSTGRRVRISSFTAPHRYADAYFRDSLLDGQAFDKTAVGKSLRAATAEDCRALYEREPLSVVLGAWDSHRKGRVAKFPRLYRSEVVGVNPVFGRRAAGRMDPHNMVGAVANGAAATDGSAGWEHVAPNGKSAKGEKLSEIGHGNITPVAAHGGVTVESAVRMASLSMAGLARLRFGDAPLEAATAARVALAALALVGDRLAFGGSGLWLRSGCELVVVDEEVAWQRRGGQREPFELGVDEALRVFEQARARAAEHGLVMSDEVLRLRPGKGLAKAWEHAYLSAAVEEDRR